MLIAATRASNYVGSCHISQKYAADSIVIDYKRKQYEIYILLKYLLNMKVKNTYSLQCLKPQ